MRVLGIVFGIIIGLVGLGLLLLGVVMRTAVGGNGEVGTDLQLFGTESRGFVTRTVDLGAVGALPFIDTDDLTMTFEVQAVEGETFIGVGPADEVDAYLAGVDVEQIRTFDLDPFDLGTNRTGGDVVPPPPGAMGFWTSTAVATGEPTSVEIDLSQGRQRLVIMNTDGSPQVGINADVTVELGFLSTLAWVLIGIGAALLVGGVALLVAAVRSGRSDRGGPTGAWRDPYYDANAATPTTGVSGGFDPRDPRNPPFEKSKMPPSLATIRYPSV